MKSNGTVWAWGYNNHGQLGDSTNTNRRVPVHVHGLSGATRVAGGGTHSIALRNDSTAWAWGDNNYGELGDGTNNQRTTPVPCDALTGLVAVAAGGDHSLMLKGDGTVYGAGYNAYYQLGDGSNSQSNSPVQASGLTNVIAISMGGFRHALALKSDHSVWSWGWNNMGQLGVNDTINGHIPEHVATLTGIDAIAGGWEHSAVVKNDGTVWTFGNNLNGQLGEGTITRRLSPVQVIDPCGSTASVGEVLAPESIAAFPNPSTGMFNVQWPTNAAGMNWEVVDLMGATVMRSTRSSNGTEIDLRSRPDGIYFLLVSDARTRTITKLVVQR